MYKRILISTDGSKCSELAIQEGLDLAKKLSASITFLNAVEDPTKMMTSPEIMNYDPNLYETSKRIGEESLARAKSMADKAGVHSENLLVEHCDPVEAILKGSKEADLIVIGSHGRSGFNRLVFGSVAEGVIRRADIPCLIVRANKVAEQITTKQNTM